MNIYELNTQIKDIEDFILDYAEANEGDITGCNFEVELDSLEMEKTDKLVSMGVWFKNLTAEAKAIKDEKDALDKRQKALDNKASRIKSYIHAVLGEGNKINEPQIVLSWRKSKSLELKVSAEVLPAEFQNLTITENKSALKADILENGIKGQAWQYAKITESQNLQIK